MSAETLVFFQNFYTNVTLYAPAEPAAAAGPPTVAATTVVTPAPPVPPPNPVVPVPPARLPAAALPAASPALTFAAPGATTVAADALAAPNPSIPAFLGLVPQLGTLAEVAPTPVVPLALLTPFATLGSRADGLVLLMRLPPDQFNKLHRNVFLNKMLQALGLVMADVVLVNVESHLPVALASLRREIAATQIVAFGRNLLDVTVRNTQIYEPVQFTAQNLSYLAAAEIEMVEYDVSLKKRLWPGLQRMFLH